LLFWYCNAMPHSDDARSQHLEFYCAPVSRTTHYKCLLSTIILRCIVAQHTNLCLYSSLISSKLILPITLSVYTENIFSWVSFQCIKRASSDPGLKFSSIFSLLSILLLGLEDGWPRASAMVPLAVACLSYPPPELFSFLPILVLISRGWCCIYVPDYSVHILIFFSELGLFF
jgi:hypothetical protein